MLEVDKVRHRGGKMVFPKAAWHTIGRTKVVTEFSFVTFSDPSEKVYVTSGDLDGY